MQQSKFFSVYILIHCIILALVVGMAAAAFSMSNGLLLLENPTTATTSANSRAAMVGKVEVAKDKIKKSIKPVVGGCEVWDTPPGGMVEGYYRIKTWGTAASSVSECLCPGGSTKVLIDTKVQPITYLGNPQDEWRLKYNIVVASYAVDPQAWPNTYVYLEPICTSSVPTTSQYFALTAGSLISENVTATSVQRYWFSSSVPSNIAQQFGYCFIAPGSYVSKDCCIDTAYCCPYYYDWDETCDCPTVISPNCYYMQNPIIVYPRPLAKTRAGWMEGILNSYYGIPHDDSQISTLYTPPSQFASRLSILSGIGLVIFNHKPGGVPLNLPPGATSTVQKWVCVSNNDEGWDNNWGLP
mgnify:FL=1